MGTLLTIIAAAGIIALARILTLCSFIGWIEEVELAAKQERQLTRFERFIEADMLHMNKSGYSRIMRAIDFVSWSTFALVLIVLAF